MALMTDRKAGIALASSFATIRSASGIQGEIGHFTGREAGTERFDIFAGSRGDEFVGMMRSRGNKRREFEEPRHGRELTQGVLAHDGISLAAIAARVHHADDFLGPIAIFHHRLLERARSARATLHAPPLLGNRGDDEPEHPAAEEEGDKEDRDQVLSNGMFERHGPPRHREREGLVTHTTDATIVALFPISAVAAMVMMVSRHRRFLARRTVRARSVIRPDECTIVPPSRYSCKNIRPTSD